MTEKTNIYPMVIEVKIITTGKGSTGTHEFCSTSGKLLTESDILAMIERVKSEMADTDPSQRLLTKSEFTSWLRNSEFAKKHSVEALRPARGTVWCGSDASKVEEEKNYDGFE